MGIYVIAKPEYPGRAEMNGVVYPDIPIHTLQFTDPAELTGATLVTENYGPIVCAAGSLAVNAAMTEAYQYDGATGGWVEV